MELIEPTYNGFSGYMAEFEVRVEFHKQNIM